MSHEARAADWVAAGQDALRRARPRLAVQAFDRAIAASGDDPEPRALRALALARAGHSVRARTELLELGRATAEGARIALRVLLAIDGPLEALEIADVLLARVPADRVALEARVEAATRLGWTHEAVIAIAALLARCPQSGDAHDRAARFFGGMDDDAAALEHARRAAECEPTSCRIWLGLARAAERVDLEEARRAVVRASERVGRDLDQLREVADARILVGDYAGAEVDLATVLELRPNDADASLGLAELALWREDVAASRARAGAVLAAAPDDPRALGILIGASVVQGKAREALALCDRVPAAVRDSTLRHWRAEALFALGEKASALAEIDLAFARTRRSPVTFLAQRLRINTAIALDEGHASEAPRPDTLDLLHSLEPIVGTPDAAVMHGDNRALLDHLERAIRALGGNRSDRPTMHRSGVLERIALGLDARGAARRLQGTLRTRPPGEVLAAFDDLLAEYGERATIHCHRGEVRLWLGDHEAAVRDFDRALAIDRATRWAWIGKVASALGLGDLEAADQACLQSDRHVGAPARTMFVVRGELHLRRGRLGEASRDLEHARQIDPQRLSARLLLALVHAANGCDDRCMHEVAEARELAPGLFHDVVDEGSAPASAARAALAAMRGNRSTALASYFTRDGRMRFIPSRGQGLDR